MVMIVATKGSRFSNALRGSSNDPTLRIKQIIAAVFLPFLVLVLMPLTVAFRQLLEGTLLANLSGFQATIISFVATFLVLGFFLGGIWLLFFWVRSGGWNILNAR